MQKVDSKIGFVRGQNWGHAWRRYEGESRELPGANVGKIQERTSPWRELGRDPGPPVGLTIPPDWSEFVLSPRTDSLLSGNSIRSRILYANDAIRFSTWRYYRSHLYTLNVPQFFKFHAPSKPTLYLIFQTNWYIIFKGMWYLENL